MKIKITAQPLFALPIPLATINILMKMAEHHYDSRCKEAYRLGGFLFGWRNLTEYAPDQPITATLDQIDITLKIAENTAIYCPAEDRQTLKIISDLRDNLYAAVTHWKRTRDVWVTELDTGPNAGRLIPLRF